MSRDVRDLTRKIFTRTRPQREPGTRLSITDVWEFLKDRAIYFAMAGILVIAAVGIYFYAQAIEEFKRHCKEDLGGIYDSKTTTSPGTYDSDGDYVPGTSTTTHYCLSKDGGILDIA